MPVSDVYREHAADLVSLVGPVTMRRMFGGVGLYLGGVMFGLLDDDCIYLKTDEESRPTWLAAGCAPWVYPGRNGPQETSYFRPPDAAHDSAEEMLPWARLAVEASRRNQARKPAPPPAPRRHHRQQGGVFPGQGEAPAAQEPKPAPLIGPDQGWRSTWRGVGLRGARLRRPTARAAYPRECR